MPTPTTVGVADRRTRPAKTGSSTSAARKGHRVVVDRCPDQTSKRLRQDEGAMHPLRTSTNAT